MTEPTKKPARILRKRVGGVEIVRDRRDCDVMADRSHTEFLQGDSLALFRCMAMWQEAGQPFSSLPAWAIDAWAQIGVTYYQETVEWIENEAQEWVEKATAAKAGKDPSDKGRNEARPSRLKKSRSFEKIAGISRGQRKPNAWKLGKDDAMQAYFDAIVQKAESDPGLNKASPLNKRLTSRGRFVRIRTLSGKTVRVLNDRGQPTELFQHAVMELFGMGAGKGNNEKSKARTSRRHRRGGMADK